MELDPVDTIEQANDAARDASSRLNMAVAVAVAVAGRIVRLADPSGWLSSLFS